MRILITGVGGPTPRSFAISLKKYSTYKDYELYATDINPLSVGLYQKELFKESFVIPRASDAQYWDAIDKIVLEKSIDVAVVLPELEVIEWCRRDKRSKLPCKALLPDLAMGQMLINKAEMTRLLSGMGVVPCSIEISRDEANLNHVFDTLGSIFWVRSSSGTSGLGSLKIDSIDALKNWIQINPNVEKFLASEFLPGRNLACKMLYFDGKLRRAACAERLNYIMSKVAPSGITGNTSFGRLLNEASLVRLAENALNRLFELTQSVKHGFFTVDFKENNEGVPLITEINVRHVAFTQCFAAAGANFAEDTIRLLDGDLSFSQDTVIYEFEEGLIFLRDVDSLPILMKEQQLLK